jgi:Tfp pilus assembly protein PilF
MPMRLMKCGFLALCGLVMLAGSLHAQENPPVPTVLPDSDTWFQMGMEMLAKGDPKAREVFARAIAADPNNWQAMLMRGILFDCTRDIDARNALQSFDDALKVNSAADAVYLGRGNCYAVRGQIESAINDYAAAIRLNPAYAQTAITSIFTGITVLMAAAF